MGWCSRNNSAASTLLFSTARRSSDKLALTWIPCSRCWSLQWSRWSPALYRPRWSIRLSLVSFAIATSERCVSLLKNFWQVFNPFKIELFMTKISFLSIIYTRYRAWKGWECFLQSTQIYWRTECSVRSSNLQLTKNKKRSNIWKIVIAGSKDPHDDILRRDVSLSDGSRHLLRFEDQQSRPSRPSILVTARFCLPIYPGFLPGCRLVTK